MTVGVAHHIPSHPGLGGWATIRHTRRQSDFLEDQAILASGPYVSSVPMLAVSSTDASETLRSIILYYLLKLKEYYRCLSC